MIQKHRINTNIGRDQKVTVEIKQDFDILEILSLKFTQKEIFASGNCSDYGVVVGRVSANNGFGVPNAKVSIFIPQKDLDVNDPVISSLYPYTQTNDKDQNGYRYNLLPARQQHPGHNPTGTFPDQLDILTREEVLEVFESYYSYTVKTNSAGDFMIWGVPIGVQTIHVDLDLSDIGCFSLRPYDFIRKGYGIDDFERSYKFKSSEDLDGLPQIVTFDRSVEVYPLWGNEDMCEIGITRIDFDLSDRGIKIEPISLILVSSITDDDSDAVKRNGHIRKNTGYKCNLQTTGGKIECVRYTGNNVLGSDGETKYPELEFFNVTEVIDDNGVAMAVLPMNMEYVYTNVFGEEEITNDHNKGIPTTTTARFRFSLNYNSAKVAVANYLVPNIREFNPNSDGTFTNQEYNEGMLTSYQFSDVFEDYIKITPPSGVTINSTNYNDTAKSHKTDLMLNGAEGDGVPEDYFYKFIYGKVYTVSSFQGTHYETARRDAFLGIKQIRPNAEEDCSSKANYFPTNFGFKNRTKFSLLLSQVVLFIQYIFAIILMKFAEIIGKLFYDFSKMFYNIGIRRWRPFRKISERFENAAYNTQEKFTTQLPLTIYPDCEECTSDDNTQTRDSSFVNDYCRVAEMMFFIRRDGPNRRVYISIDRAIGTGFFFNQTNQPSVFADPDDKKNYIFEGEYAKDNEGLCSGSTVLNYWDLTGMTSQTVPIVHDGDMTERFVATVYPYDGDQLRTGVTFSDFVCYFNTEMDGDPSNTRIIAGTAWGVPSLIFAPNTATFFTYDEWNELTGMDFDNLTQGGEELALLPTLRIYDRALMKENPISADDINIEEGCSKYDKTYNEQITLGYLWSSGTTYGNLSSPYNPVGVPESADNITSYADAVGYREFLRTTVPPALYDELLSTLIGATNTRRLPYKKVFRKIPDSTYDRKTKSGLSEFRDGVFTLIPVINGKSYNLQALREWYRRKRVGLFFCGGVVNYSFIDNWLHGLVYFFKFDKRIRWDNEENFDLNQRGSRYPRELIFFNVLDKRFYYRSCPYNMTDKFVGQTFGGHKEILHPTTFYDVGVRDEFLSEICTDSRVDPYCSVIRELTTTSYQDPANIVEYAINYRLDINDGKFDVDDFFSKVELGSNIKVFDGDITQLMSINCEAGIEAFDLDSPHYFMYNGEYMDPENPAFGNFFKQGGQYGPTPIDFKFDSNGAFIRGCLNNRLGDYTQLVPFYLWDKKGSGFGDYGDNSDDQVWDRNAIIYDKLQLLTPVSSQSTPNYLKTTEEKYLLKPMTITHDTFSIIKDAEDMLERFELITDNVEPTDTTNYIEGDLCLQVTESGPSGYLKDPTRGWIWVVVNSVWVKQVDDEYVNDVRETFIPQTITNYTGEKQVLSTPFLFYFGLRPEKSSLDILTKYFGPKGAFGYESCPPIE